MNKLLMTGLCFVASKLMQGAYQGTTEDLAKLKLATVYLHVVKITRLLFIGLLGSGACLIFLLIGLVLVHHAILLSAWTADAKMTATLICAASYVLIAVGIFAYVFAEDKWMKMFNTNAVVKELTEK